MKILVVAAHPDDEMLGIGGTIAKHTKSGDEVKILILGQGMLSRGDDLVEEQKELEESSVKANQILGVTDIKHFNLPDNEFDKISLLNIIQSIEDICLDFGPDIVYTHFGNDLNIDHRRTFQAVMTIFRPMPNTPHPKIYSFFIPSSTDWVASDPKSHNFIPNSFVDVGDYIDIKLKALKLYESEIEPYPHSRSIESINNISKYWGNRVGIEYAEPLILIRELID